jgi:hypothetical protein
MEGLVMASVKLNPVLEGIHGKVGDLVFKRYEDEVIIARKPDHVTQPNTPAQVAVKERFKLAAFYGKTANADPATKAIYAGRAKEKHIPVFALMVADFFNAPVINEVDLSSYAGRTGDIIRIQASDDFEIRNVSVQMREPETGEEIDGGAAVLGPNNIWSFTAQSNIPPDHPFVIEVSATDRPGHKGTKTLTHTVH